MTLPDTTHYRRGAYAVGGVLAEVLSVLEGAALWTEDLAGPVTMDFLVETLDTSRLPEERIVPGLQILETLITRDQLCRWIPWYSRLFESEYSSQFYSGYRDHTLHSLQVYLLGLYLYETVGPLRDSLAARLRRDSTARFTDTQLFLRWWTLTALWHDIAYPLEATMFLTDSTTQQRILHDISAALGRDPFTLGLQEVSDRQLTADLKRKLYQLGGYYPFEFNSAQDILGGPRVQRVVDALWRRLGVGIGVDSPLLELDLLTTQSPTGRPPYHDHGLFGAALLASMADEAETFLARLAELPETIPLYNLLPSLFKAIATAWEDFVDLGSVIDLSVEAIAFHNISFSQLQSSVASERLVPVGFRTAIPLDTEPHLFFLAIVDTLQDWDRHHYVPNTPACPYRPAVRSSEMLLQGDGGSIRVQIATDANARQTMISLFAGWLREGDVESLFTENPVYSHPERLSTLVPASLEESQKSARIRQNLIEMIDRETRAARDTLIGGAPDSVIIASSQLESVLRNVEEASRQLVLSDRRDVEGRLAARGIKQLREQAYKLIVPGCRLPYGVVEETLGHGGFGTVFRVEAGGKSSADCYAFKLYHERDLEDVEKLRLFRRGYKAMEALGRHPNIVDVRAFSEVPVGFYMEFVPGRNLEAGIDDVGTVHERLRLAIIVAETVRYAHAQAVRVLHRDIKPGNVLLDSSRGLRPILTDFDLAWIESYRTQPTKEVYATIHYGAPEQFEVRWRDFRQSPTVDVYSVGALIYFALLKQVPPHWSTWSETHWRVLEERLVEDLPAIAVTRLVQLLQKMTVGDPSRRIGSVAQVVYELNRIEGITVGGGRLLVEADWEQQVVYRVTGVSTSTSSSFQSRAGNVEWRVKARADNECVRVEVEAGLVIGPRFEGVAYSQYRAAVARRIDDRIGLFKEQWKGLVVQRTGFPTEASKARIRIDGLPRTAEGANALALLIGELSRAIE